MLMIRRKLRRFQEFGLAMRLRIEDLHELSEIHIGFLRNV